MPVSLHHTSAFDLDDAFSDGEEHGMSYSFSPGSIRDDLAKSMEASGQNGQNWGTPAEIYHYDGFLNGTISIPPTISNDDDEEPNAEAGSRSPTPPSPSPSALTADFSQISLATPTEEVPVDSGIPAETESSEGEQVVPYPNVIIDASQTPNRDSVINRVQDVQDSGAKTPPPQLEPLQEAVHSSPSLPTTHQSHPLQHERINSASASSLASPPLPTIIPGSSPDKNPREIKSTQPPFRHRPTRSVGPSALEKVRSRTRPAFLPPKSRQEDDKHMADWEAIMQLSRITGRFISRSPGPSHAYDSKAEKRRRALQERRVMREAQVEASLNQWEKEIVPDWTVINRNPSLRKLWWSGIPTRLRASMWEKAVGNGLALGKGRYLACRTRLNDTHIQPIRLLLTVWKRPLSYMLCTRKACSEFWFLP